MKTLIRCLTLALLSAVIAEFLLGDQWLHGVGSAGEQIGQLGLFTAFYGSAAVGIREIARRTGRGWPTILLLGLAFGLVEEGIVDQSLFNPDFAGLRLLDPGFIPALGIGAPWTIFVLSLHVIWSIATPIALAEAIFPTPLGGRGAVTPQHQAPWLGVPGIVVATCLYLLGATAIFAFSATSGFMASPPQLIASAVLAAVVVVIALRQPRRRPRAPRPVLPAVLIGLVLTSGVQAVSQGLVSPWVDCLLFAALFAVGIAAAVRWRLDVTGLALGAVLTYSWLGMTKAVPLGAGPVLEQSLLVVAVLVCAALGLRRSGASRALASAGR